MIFQKWPKRQVTLTFTHKDAACRLFSAMMQEAFQEYSQQPTTVAESGDSFIASNGVTITATWPAYSALDLYYRISARVQTFVRRFA